MASLDKRLIACYDERMNKPLIKHTPGPWIIGKQDHDVITVDTANGTAICDVYVDSDDRRPPANARLIAAAPDLLAALDRLERLSWSALAPDDPVREWARAAIAKAKDATKEKP